MLKETENSHVVGGKTAHESESKYFTCRLKLDAFIATISVLSTGAKQL